jgi:hypothetical protein
LDVEHEENLALTTFVVKHDPRLFLPNSRSRWRAACHAQDVRLSPVLHAMGVDPEWGMGTLRLTVGRYTTEGEVDEAVRVIARGAEALL